MLVSKHPKQNQRLHSELWAVTVEGTSGCGGAVGTVADGNPVLGQAADIHTGYWSFRMGSPEAAS